MNAPNHYDLQQQTHEKHGLGLPTFGFLVSIALTVLALWSSNVRNLGREFIITTLLTLAMMQIGIQLFFFMHVTESDERPWHIGLLALALLLVAVIVAGSIWIMTFGTEAY